MKFNRSFVEDVIYGWNSARRFLQDDPIRPDVWIAFAENPGDRQSLLEPLIQVRPGTIANGLGESLGDEGLRQTDLTYNQSSVAAKLTFEEVVRLVLPRTAWWVDANAATDEDLAVGGGQANADAVPDPAMLREDLEALNEGYRLQHFRPEVLTLVRIVGLLAYALTTKGAAKDDPLLRAYRKLGTQNANGSFLDALTKAITRGWAQLFGNRLPECLGDGGKQIYAINLDRMAETAVHRSALTIKADAARLLFDIRCASITWAIVDSGIDATHPAFRSGSPEEEARIAAIPVAAERRKAMLKASRVVETYDFTRVRDLLAAAMRPDDAEAILTRLGLGRNAVSLLRQNREYLIELERLMQKGRDIDWEVLRPILRLLHDETYQPPRNPHGTHVAGILGANWKRTPEDQPDGTVRGVCPDIRLIDVRVADDNGRGSEFAI